MALYEVPCTIVVEADNAQDAQDIVLTFEVGSPVTGIYGDMTVGPLDDIVETATVDR